MVKTLSKKTEKSHKNDLHSTRIDISAKVRLPLVEILNETLASTFDLFSQVKQAHWNVKGKNFYQLHLLFDEIAQELLGFVDEIAERVTTLGGTAMGTIRMASSATNLDEYPVDIFEGLDHIAALADKFSVYCQLVRSAIDKATELGDADTADLYTEISRQVDKRLWFLEAHIQVEES